MPGALRPGKRGDPRLRVLRPRGFQERYPTEVQHSPGNTVANIRIGELLIKEGLITQSQLDQSLTAQKIFGGRLGTNLVEHGYVSEVDLARLLARQLGIKMVEPGALAAIEPRILALVPADVARRYSVVPFAHDTLTDRVSLAMADPLNLQKIDEISFALGKRIDFFVCPEIMLAFGLEKHYGVERKRRYVRVLGISDSEIHLAAEDRPANRSAAGAPASVRRGSHEEMLQRIVKAATKRELIATTVDVLASSCGQIAFFVVRGEDALAWDARGVQVAPDALRGISLPLALTPLLNTSLESCQEYLVPRIADPALREILDQRLAMDCSGTALVLPLIVNRKGFGVAVLTQLDDDFNAQVPFLVELMKRVGYKLQIFFLAEMLSAPI